MERRCGAENLGLHPKPRQWHDAPAPPHFSSARLCLSPKDHTLPLGAFLQPRVHALEAIAAYAIALGNVPQAFAGLAEVHQDSRLRSLGGLGRYGGHQGLPGQLHIAAVQMEDVFDLHTLVMPVTSILPGVSTRLSGRLRSQAKAMRKGSSV